MDEQKRILVTGTKGLLGSAMKRVFDLNGQKSFFVDKTHGDLENSSDVKHILNEFKPELIVHTAAVVGGIQYNMEKPEELRDRNRSINQHILNYAFELKVNKTISFLSTCIFPEDAPEPWDESMIHLGEPDKRQWGYAVAKRELDLLSKQLNAKSNNQSKFLTMMPSSMYGLNDNFDPNKSHVIPSVISKIFNAKKTGEPPVFWGSGNPRREFLLSDDMARAVFWALGSYESEESLIVSPLDDTSVKEVVIYVSKYLDYSGEIKWDREKPDGRFTRRTSNKKFLSLIKSFSFTPFEEGIKSACQFFVENFPQIRGLKNR
ncbi:MAG: NAD-dependent epimerase/dehydratase family protein [Elusimicrobiota bacterium]